MSTSDISQQSVERRYVRHRGASHIPLALLYAVPLIFALLLILTCLSVQSRTERAVERALAAAGVADWAVPRVSGRHVTLTGTPPNSDAANKAYSAAIEARARSLFGAGRQPVRVRTAYGTPGVTVPTETARLMDWRFERNGDVLRLLGSVPDQATRDAVLTAADLSLGGGGPSLINDELTVTDEAVHPAGLPLTVRAIALLEKCTQGRAELVEGVFGVDCDARPGQLAALRSLAEQPLPTAMPGPIDIRESEEGAAPAPDPISERAVADCENALSALLGSAQIQFQTAEALIYPASDPLLSRVAAAVERCPGTLRIEGHTDDTGPTELNDSLSRQRAIAVRSELIERGVDPRRLVAEGFGARRPVADNETEAGRARNRRIEINVIRDGE